ncbi:Cof subfamily protein (haloacid dehalogenase superfamily) [Breznakia sp. PF5-3]|uniref:Cof-type HAD-IIB family hydrolase n=1 Tax=unclassified Breznakia TaxID=2623764 RepID=UPI0024062989|nr:MULTISPECIES: Cof-type HAD-IIB family hydrolase [unclassified Breznakia]MDF9823676.1 Cof subfamily protein (haloacid dehalogenase superfamily) [Breznakia sp. PM6-1]MDF9834474.1 Cof subfamily protein (haloacid dehalogenase superfamily) [Breznakia sp. PF5-3]MDF9838481.1 Cof subfamily protein (haloacid dehalogenase superfamily) [Breznakia sp. PFB2-8]MDF9859132.1 Cof subfamily protein (haloacid dehalogenase superfamily) [Breznakia sp. PH5-24]
MSIKAIILDIDGTLLNSEKTITKRTHDCLMEAQKKGIKLILASGRPTSGMMIYAKMLEMEKYHGLLISYNGAKVIDCQTQEVVFNKAMSINEGKAVLEHLKKFNVIPMIDKDDYMYVNDVYNCWIKYQGKDINIIQYESRGGNYKLCEKDDLAAFLDYDINKILTAADPAYLKEHYQAMSEPFKDSLNCMFTADFFYEFTAKGIDKAKALDSVLPPMGIKQDETIAFGDGHNDISMIEYAEIGVAMENAVDELKAIATFVTLGNEDDGIAYALEKYLKI